MTAILINAVGTWITLIIVIHVVARFADLSVPPFGETAWKVAVIALASNATAALLGNVHFFLSWIGSLVVLYILLKRWFDADVMALIIILVASWLVQMFLGIALAAILVTAS